MNNNNEVTISVLDTGDIDSAVAILTSSMKNNPNWKSIFPKEHSRLRAVRILMEILIHDAIPFGHTYGAYIKDKLAGVIVVHPPGTYKLSFQRKLKAMPYLFKMMMIIPKDFRDFAKFGDELNKLHPKEPHWYIDAIGIAPEYQRIGLGSRLMNTVLKIIDEKKELTYLETEIEPNVEWYIKNFGFIVTGEKIKVIPTSPYFYRMLRK